VFSYSLTTNNTITSHVSEAIFFSFETDKFQQKREKKIKARNDLQFFTLAKENLENYNNQLTTCV
jgi:hypothetical protein